MSVRFPGIIVDYDIKGSSLSLVNTNTNSYSTGTITQNGTIITGVGTFFTSSMVGGIIEFDIGPTISTTYITGYVNPTTLTVSNSQIVSIYTNYILYYGGLQADSSGYMTITKNLSTNNVIYGYQTIVTSSSTTNLTVLSPYQTYFTGSNTHSLVLPVVSTLVIGQSYLIVNNSAGIVTVYSSNGSSTVLKLNSNSWGLFTCISTFGNTNISWSTSNNNQSISIDSTNSYSYYPVFTVGSGSSQLSISTSQYAINPSNGSLQLGDISIGGIGSPAYVGNGSNNIAIGPGAGNTNIMGSNNILLGGSSNVGSNVSNAVVIGQGSSASYNSVVIGKNINDTTGGASTAGLFMFHRGPVTAKVNIAGWIPGTNELVEVTSSRRFKENISILEDPCDKIDKLKPVRYTPKLGHGRTPTDLTENIGFIAEEVEEIYPEVVTKDSDGITSGMMYDRLIPVLVREIQLLRARVSELEDIVKKNN